MKISCTKENLTQALTLVSGATGKNINLPILNNILIKVSENKTEFITTNLELAVIVVVRAKIEEIGSFTVPARTLTDIVNLLPNENIQFSVKDNELIVTCGKSSTKIKGTLADDFPIIPSLPTGKGYLLNAVSLKQGLSDVLSSAAKNDIRPELSGIFCYFDTNEKRVVLAATDSYRLAEKKIKLEQGDEELKIIIPAKSAQEINHLLNTTSEEGEKEKNAKILVGDNQIVVSFNNAQIISRLVEGQYPDYTQIIPKDFNIIITADTEKFIKEMKAAGLFTTTGVNSIALNIKAKTGVVEISSVSSQTGEYKSELQTEIKGGDGTIMLNNRYVLDGLNNFNSAELQLKIINADSACVITPKGDESYLYIVMPIRQ
ncbi:MAG: DNA polymerase III subunit beta [Patescibacteria group bacterium]|jgi:DNA polymerase-3 subunit beta